MAAVIFPIDDAENAYNFMDNTFIKDVALKNISGINLCINETGDRETARIIHAALMNSAKKVAERFNFNSAKRPERLKPDVDTTRIYGAEYTRDANE